MTQRSRPTATIKVRVQPRASRNEIVGYQGDVLRLRVTAPPTGGQANDAVAALLAEALGLAKSQVRVVRGAASRGKLVAVESLAREEVRRRLQPWTG